LYVHFTVHDWAEMRCIVPRSMYSVYRSIDTLNREMILNLFHLASTKKQLREKAALGGMFSQ